MKKLIVALLTKQSMLRSGAKKMFLGVLLSVAALSVAASPALAEKQEFCQTVAKNHKAGADAKKLGMTPDELDSRIMLFVMNLIHLNSSTISA